MSPGHFRYRSIRRWISISIFAALPACTSFCDQLLDCSGDYLFQYWTASPGGDGGAGVPYIDLSKAHYGAGQNFYMGGCTYLVDIEADDSQSSGTFSFSSPEPDTQPCVARSGTQTWTLSCGQLVVRSAGGSEAFEPQAAGANQ